MSTVKIAKYFQHFNGEYYIFTAVEYIHRFHAYAPGRANPIPTVIPLSSRNARLFWKLL